MHSLISFLFFGVYEKFPNVSFGEREEREDRERLTSEINVRTS